MKKKLFAVFSATILISLVGLVCLYSYDSQVSGQTKSVQSSSGDELNEIRSSSDGLPDRVFFDMLFNTVLSMDKAAADLRSKGKTGEIWQNYFERRANLSKPQVDELKQTTAEFERAIAPLQSRALQVINERRAARTPGRGPRN